MAKGFYISKTLGVVGIVLGAGAVATIIALSVVYAQEKSKNVEVEPVTTTVKPPPVVPTSPAPPNDPWHRYRLPDSLMPDTYNVTLWPHLEPDAQGMYMFTGDSSVIFRCVKETDLILIHSNKLELTLFDGFLAKLLAVDGSASPAITKTWLQEQTQYLVVQLNGKLTVGKSYELQTQFRGELADDLAGFYRSEYYEDGVKKVVATSQMHPTHARKTFPCFDEPAMKAVFHITLIHRPGTVALSNGKDVDQIALPDFYFGAMENWGLVTYRETNLLYDPIVSSNANKERTASIIAHELAHMWFGNLVTLRWWNEVWLNEGFASYVEYLGADYAEPTWNIKELIVLNDVHRVFAIDALASSHPLSSKEEEIYKPEQISELFDAISYSKTYLKDFAYSNTVGTDLWDHLQRAVVETNTPLPDTVHEIMNRWVLQMGFPVVTINTATGEVSQQHFLLDPESAPDRPSEYNYEWYIPVRWMKSGAAQDQFWLLTDRAANKNMTAAGAEWVLANLNVTGYYRVNYDLENWNRLLTQLNTNHQVIPVINRAQLVDDAFNLARYNQVNAIRMACRTGVEGCEELTTGWFNEWMMNPDINPIHPNLRTTVYCSAIAAGGVAEWDFGWEMFLNASMASEAEKLRSALACTKEPWLLNRYLEYTLDPTKIRKQDATSTIVYIASNVVGQPLAWDFVRSRWEYIFTEYGASSFSFAELISGVTKRFSTEFELKQLQKFQEDNAQGGFGSGTVALEQSIERTKANIKWLSANQKQVKEWFENEAKPKENF
ncbi:hypothetical protein ANANG_G00208350 [Anguilla anguilla]|uniref:Aminopeptidase n=1 Tax=Anguilla anguilla TaxID=7936 RepID=A0A9D3RQR8_ANGAN|nr:hypothetical protein ANANG_G00208350 [Anguilla anguilla]